MEVSIKVLTSTTCNYDFELDRREKILLVTLSGVFKPLNCERFCKDYEKAARKLPWSTYLLVVDMRELMTFSPDHKEDFATMLKGFITESYSKRYILRHKSAIALRQCERLLRSIPGSDTLNFIESIEDIRR